MQVNPVEREQLKELYIRATSNIFVQASLVVFLFCFNFYMHEFSLSYSLVAIFCLVMVLVRYYTNKSNLKIIDTISTLDLLKSKRTQMSVILFFYGFAWAFFTTYPMYIFDFTHVQDNFHLFFVCALVISGMGAMGISKIHTWIFIGFQFISMIIFFVKTVDNIIMLTICLGFLAFFGVYAYIQQSSIEKLWRAFVSEKLNQQYLLQSFPGLVCLMNNKTLVFSNDLFIQTRLNNEFFFNHDLSQHLNDFQNQGSLEISFESNLKVNGSEQAYLFILSKLPNDQTIIVGLNIQNQKDKEAQIKEQRALLDQSSKMAALGEMSGGIAHEINNPLAVITLSTRKLRTDISKLKISELSVLEGLNKSFDKVESMVNRISKIIKALRAFARDGSLDPLEVINFSTVLDDTLAFCESKFINSSIQIVKNVSPELKISCRPTEISQVLLNIFNNSYDAMMNSNPPIDIKILTISTHIKNKIVQIVIQDTGHGIPEAIRSKLMQPFFTTKDIGQGTGLGLSISRSIMQSHGGQIYFDFHHKETTVILELPII